MISILVKLINICMYISGILIIVAPSALISKMSDPDSDNIWLYFIIIAYFLSYPTLLDHVKNKQIDEGDILINSIGGVIASAIVILVGFTSYDPWATRGFIGAIVASFIFVFKVAIKK
jgi:hypothetical protein